MCTLSYLPNSNGYFLVNNRDESPHRAKAIEPKLIVEKDITVLAPIDAHAKGTWIGVNNLGSFVCLMNGAFEAHKRNDFYAKSRGLIAKDFLFSQDTSHCFESYNLDEIEPFTILHFDEYKLMEYRWDGEKKYSKLLDLSKPHIWSSVTLYNAAIANERLQYFEEQYSFFQQHQNELINFHKNEIDDAPPILLARQEVQTVSITSVFKHKKEVTMSYEDLLQDKAFIQKLELI